MPYQIKIKPHLSTSELKKRYLKCKDAKEARRWHALWLISDGMSAEAAARVVGFNPVWVRRFLCRYNDQGPDAILDGHKLNPGGERTRLNDKQQLKLLKALQSPPSDAGLWSGPKVAAWIERETGKPAHPQLGWDYLRRLGKSAQTPRRRHISRATEEEKKALKKTKG
jgi:transposase